MSAHLDHEVGEVAAEVEEESEEGPEVDGRFEGRPRRVYPQGRLGEDEVPGATDGEELRQPLEETQQSVADHGPSPPVGRTRWRAPWLGTTPRTPRT